MRHLPVFFALFSVLLTGPSCNKSDDPGKNNPYKPIDLSTKSAEFVSKGNSFAISFLDHVNSASAKDYIISPLSMQFLLGMVLDGADGETSDEICGVLGYGKGEKEAVDQFCLSMMEQLPQIDKMTKLSIANALFADNSVPVLDSYREIAGKFYKAEIANMDFAESDASMKRINDWCSKNTNGMIPSVLDEMSPKIVLYMFNALYFKGEWKAKFKTADTADEAFTDEAGVKSKIPMMKQVQKHDYMENEVFQAVDLAYGNEAFSMTVLLPKPGHKVADVIAALKDSPLDKVRGKMYNSELSLWLPKFETKSRIKLNDILSAMGMKQAFNSSQADFSALSPVRLWLNYLQQDAVIKVDEEGSEAAAVSQGGFSKELAAEPDVFHADHPFLYLISERSTGAIIFAGRFSGK